MDIKGKWVKMSSNCPSDAITVGFSLKDAQLVDIFISQKKCLAKCKQPCKAAFFFKMWDLSMKI